LGVFLLKNTLKNKAQKNLEGSFYPDGQFIEHPDSKLRFSALNELTNLYYSNQSNEARTNESELVNIRIVAAKESNDAFIKIMNSLRQKNAVAFNKQKLYEAERNKIALAQSKKSNYLSSFHEFHIFPLYTLNELVGGKSKCTVNNLQANLSEIYAELQTKQTRFVNDLKSGKIAPNEKCWLYSFNYLNNKNFNDLMIDIAARYKICDTQYLNNMNEEIENGKFYSYTQPDNEILTKTFNYLVSKEEEKKEKK
ncbi:MAG: hypothetical protein ABIN24_14140, partial [Dyadobacter sp.]